MLLEILGFEFLKFFLMLVFLRRTSFLNTFYDLYFSLSSHNYVLQITSWAFWEQLPCIASTPVLWLVGYPLASVSMVEFLKLHAYYNWRENNLYVRINNLLRKNNFPQVTLNFLGLEKLSLFEFCKDFSKKIEWMNEFITQIS